VVQFVDIVLPSLPLINNDRRTLASFRVPELDDLEDQAVDAVEDVLQDAGFFPSFNELPGLRDLADVQRGLTRQIDDLGDDLLADLPDRDDIGAEVEDRILDPLEQDIEDLVDDLQDLDVPTVDDVVGGVDDLVGDAEDSLSTAITDIRGDLQDDLQDVRTNVETAIDDSVDDIEEDVSGLSGALSSIGDEVGDARDRIEEVGDGVEDVLDRIPEDFEGAVESALESVEPTVDEAGLFSEPVAFAAGVIVAGGDRAVDDETEQALDQAIQDAQEFLPEER